CRLSVRARSAWRTCPSATPAFCLWHLAVAGNRRPGCHRPNRHDTRLSSRQHAGHSKPAIHGYRVFQPVGHTDLERCTGLARLVRRHHHSCQRTDGNVLQYSRHPIRKRRSTCRSGFRQNLIHLRHSCGRLSTHPQRSTMIFSTLVSADTLARHLDDPDWVIIDCRHDLAQPDAGRTAYAESHIPQARFAHLDQDLAGATIDTNGLFRGRHPLPEQERFIETLRNWGIHDTTQVVIYDAQGGMFAARLWWMLRWVGHSAVAVLDGGWQAWLAARHPVTAEVHSNNKGSLTQRPALVSAV